MRPTDRPAQPRDIGGVGALVTPLVAERSRMVDRSINSVSAPSEAAPRRAISRERRVRFPARSEPETATTRAAFPAVAPSKQASFPLARLRGPLDHRPPASPATAGVEPPHPALRVEGAAPRRVSLGLPHLVPPACRAPVLRRGGRLTIGPLSRSVRRSVPAAAEAKTDRERPVTPPPRARPRAPPRPRALRTPGPGSLSRPLRGSLRAGRAGGRRGRRSGARGDRARPAADCVSRVAEPREGGRGGRGEQPGHAGSPESLANPRSDHEVGDQYQDRRSKLAARSGFVMFSGTGSSADGVCLVHQGADYSVPGGAPRRKEFWAPAGPPPASARRPAPSRVGGGESRARQQGPAGRTPRLCLAIQREDMLDRRRPARPAPWFSRPSSIDGTPSSATRDTQVRAGLQKPRHGRGMRRFAADGVGPVRHCPETLTALSAGCPLAWTLAEKPKRRAHEGRRSP